MKTVIDCPLGHECESIKNGELHRCAWYVEMAGTAQDGNSYNESKCAIAWQPILMVEVAGTNRGQTAAIESMRNENLKRVDAALNITTGGTLSKNNGLIERG